MPRAVGEEDSMSCALTTMYLNNTGLEVRVGIVAGHVRNCYNNQGSVVTVVGRGWRGAKSDLSVYNPSHLVLFISCAILYEYIRYYSTYYTSPRLSRLWRITEFQNVRKSIGVRKRGNMQHSIQVAGSGDGPP